LARSFSGNHFHEGDERCSCQERADVDRRQDGDGIGGKQRHVPHQIPTASVVCLVEPEDVQKRRGFLSDRTRENEKNPRRMDPPPNRMKPAREWLRDGLSDPLDPLPRSTIHETTKQRRLIHARSVHTSLSLFCKEGKEHASLAISTRESPLADHWLGRFAQNFTPKRIINPSQTRGRPGRRSRAVNIYERGLSSGRVKKLMPTYWPGRAAGPLARPSDSAGLMQISWDDWCYKSRGSGINLSPLSARSASRNIALFSHPLPGRLAAGNNGDGQSIALTTTLRAPSTPSRRVARPARNFWSFFILVSYRRPTLYHED